MAVKINSSKEVGVLRKKVLEAEKEVSIYYLDIYKKTASVVVNPAPENPLVRNLEVEKKARVLDGKVVRTIKSSARFPFSKELISVRFRNLKQLHEVLAGVYVRHSGVRTRFFVESGDGFKDLISGEKKSRDAIYHEDGSLKKGVRVYKHPWASPSMLRKNQCLQVDVTGGTEHAEKLLSKATGGVYDLLKNKEVDQAGLVKAQSRLFQCLASMRDLGVINAYAIYMGKWDSDKWDGMGFVHDEYIAELLSHKLGIEVSYMATRGMGFQTRPFSIMTKTHMVGVSRRFINKLLDTGGESVRYETIDETAQREIWSGSHNGKWVIVGKGAPQVVVDLNGLKHEFDMSKEQRFELLDIAKASDSFTSGQVLQKFVQKPEELSSVVNELMDDTLDTTFGDILDRSPKVPAPSEIRNPYLVDVAGKIAPSYVTEKDRQLLEGTLRNRLSGLNKDINRFRWKVEGGHFRATADIAELLGGEPVLEFNQFFSKKAWRELKGRDSKEAVAFKYPTIQTEELLKGEVVGLGYIRKKVKNMDIPGALKQAIIEYYESLDDGIVVVSTEALLKNLLAGMDFDYDGLMLIWDRRILELVGDYVPKVVEITEDVDIEAPDNIIKEIDYTKKDKFTLGLEALDDAFVSHVDNGNLSVGLVTRINDTIVSLMSLPEEQATIGLSHLLGVEGTGDYKSPLPRVKNHLGGTTVKVNDELTKEVINRARESKFTKENVQAILEDLNIVFRRLQEKTIDSPKTGEVLDYPIRMEISADMLRNYEVSVSGTKISLKGAHQEAEDAGEVYVAEDVLGRLKKEAFVKTTNKLGSFLENNETGFSEEDMQLFREAIGDDKKLANSLATLKFMYGDITRWWLDSEEDQEYKNDKYKEVLSVLGNMVRLLTKDMDPVQRGMAAKYTSLQSESETNKFASATVPQEYLLMVDEHWGEVQNAGTEILNKGYEEGDIVEFKDGIAKHAISTKEPINGEYTITMNGNKYYAAKPIKDLVEVPEADESKIVVSIAAQSLAGNKYKEVVGKLNDSKGILLTSNAKQGDNIYAKIGEETVHVGKIVAPRGSSPLSELYNGAVGEIERVIYAQSEREDGRIFNTVTVIMEVTGRKTK